MDDTQPQKINQIEENAAEIPEVTKETKMANIMQLENMINGYMGDLEKLQEQLKDQSAMLRDGLENDAEYAACVAKAREVSKEKKTIQDKLTKDPSLSIIQEKVNDLKNEVKDIQQGLSDYLQQYYEQSGLRQITGTDGEIRELITHVKLVKKKF